MAIEVQAMTPQFGAYVTGIDVRAGVDAATHAQIEQALTRYAMLSFPGQPIDDEQQLAFSRNFGTLHFQEDVSRRRLKNGYFQDVSNIGNDNEILDADADRRIYSNANMLWHTDLSFVATPARVTVLSARELPDDPPDTQFADMRAAWDALPAARQRELEGLQAEHSVFTSRAKVGYDRFTEQERARLPPVVHPLVRTHRRSGRKSLYIASHTSHIVGWPLDEGRQLIQELIAFCTQPQFVLSYHWKPHDLICWDDSCTMHRSTPFDSMKYRRELRWNAALEPAPV